MKREMKLRLILKLRNCIENWTDVQGRYKRPIRKTLVSVSLKRAPGYHPLNPVGTNLK
jgi:hypothetical protein